MVERTVVDNNFLLEKESSWSQRKLSLSFQEKIVGKFRITRVRFSPSASEYNEERKVDQIVKFEIPSASEYNEEKGRIKDFLIRPPSACECNEQAKVDQIVRFEIPSASSVARCATKRINQSSTSEYNDEDSIFSSYPHCSK